MSPNHAMRSSLKLSIEKPRAGSLATPDPKSQRNGTLRSEVVQDDLELRTPAIAYHACEIEGTGGLTAARRENPSFRAMNVGSIVTFRVVNIAVTEKVQQNTND